MQKKIIRLKYFKYFFLIVTFSFAYFIFFKSNQIDKITSSSNELVLLENKYKDLKLKYSKHNKKIIPKIKYI